MRAGVVAGEGISRCRCPSALVFEEEYPAAGGNEVIESSV